MNKKLNYTSYLMNELYKNIAEESEKNDVRSESFFSKMSKMWLQNISWIILYMFTLFVTLTISELIKDNIFIIFILLVLWGGTIYGIYRILKKPSLREGNLAKPIYTEKYIKIMCKNVSRFLKKYNINSNQVEGLISRFESKDTNNDIDVYDNFEKNVPIIYTIISIITTIFAFSRKEILNILKAIPYNIKITITFIIILIAVVYFVSKYYNTKRRYEETQKRESVLDALYLYNIHNKKIEENRRKNSKKNKIGTNPEKEGLENLNRKEQVNKNSKKKHKKLFLKLLLLLICSRKIHNNLG